MDYPAGLAFKLVNLYFSLPLCIYYIILNLRDLVKVIYGVILNNCIVTSRRFHVIY